MNGNENILILILTILCYIVDLFENGGIEISECLAGGGIAVKNKRLMQIFADVTGKTVKVTDCAQAGAVGSAIFAASAAGVCGDMCETINKLGRPSSTVYVLFPKQSIK